MLQAGWSSLKASGSANFTPMDCCTPDDTAFHAAHGVSCRRACNERSAERLVGGVTPFWGHQPCTEIGMAFTPTDPGAANDPKLNERVEVTGPWAAGVSASIGREWPRMFQVGDTRRAGTREPYMLCALSSGCRRRSKAEGAGRCAAPVTPP